MGIQISSLSAGGSIAIPVQQEFPKEKLPPLPIEQQAALEKPKSQPQASAKPSSLDKYISDLENISQAFNNRRLKFVVDQDSREIIIKVIDNETDKVIKVLPPEELQRLHSSIRETIGVLFDKLV